MSVTVRAVQVADLMVQDRPGEAYVCARSLARPKVNLLAINAMPMGSDHTQLARFPENPRTLAGAVEKTGLTPAGPERAFIVPGVTD